MFTHFSLEIHGMKYLFPEPKTCNEQYNNGMFIILSQANTCSVIRRYTFLFDDNDRALIFMLVLCN